jgi:membrane protease subunit HflK
MEKVNTKNKDISAGIFKRTLAGIFILTACCWIALGVFTVEPGEVGILTRFGRGISESPAGLHFAVPYPFHTVRKVSMSRITPIFVGSVSQEASWITGDLNIIKVKLLVNYRVQTPGDFLFKTVEDSDSLIRCAVSAALNKTLNMFTVDEALTSRKSDIETNVKRIGQDILDCHSSGVRLLSAHLQETRPPEEVASAFREVSDARSAQFQMINEAKTYADMKASRARVEMNELEKQAYAYVEERIKMAEALGDSITKLMESADRSTVMSIAHTENMKKALPKMRKIIIPPDREGKVVLIK